MKLDITDLPEITKYLEEQQPELEELVSPSQDIHEPDAEDYSPEELATDDVIIPDTSAQQPDRPTTPIISSYPDAELSPAQKALLKSALKTDRTQLDQVIMPNDLGVSQQDTENETRRFVMPDNKQKSVQKPVKKTRKKKRADIHAFSDQQLKKRGSPAKGILIGLLALVVLVCGGSYAWYYWWTEHATFDYELQPVVVLSGQSVAASDFIYPSHEMEQVSVLFADPNFKPTDGLQYVPMTLTLGLRSLDASVTLHVMTTKDQISHEYKEAGPDLRAVDFVANLDASAGVPFDVQFVEAPKALEEYDVGEHVLKLTLNDAPFEVLLIVADTTPPTAMAVSHNINIGEPVKPEDFVESLFDHSGIMSIEFVKEPDVFSVNEQIVEVEVTDNHGNSAIFRGELTTTLNEEPPTIEGVPETIVFMVGSPVDYLDGIVALDDFGRNIEVIADTSDVKDDTEGTYTLLFTAEDFSGLKTEVTATVHVLPVDPEDIYQRVDAILERELRSNMTQEQKIRRINDWIRWAIKPSTTTSASESILSGAHKALEERRGDSRVVAALAEVMLTRAGIKNMPIVRIPDAEKEHHWNLVNPDDRGWYHFDAVPNGLGLGGGAVSMFTDKDAKDFTRRIQQSRDGIEDYYTFNPELYPEIVQE